MDKDDNEILKPGKRRSDGVEESLTSAGVAELPLARVKTIMQKGGDDLPISQEGLFAMAKAAVCIVSSAESRFDNVCFIGFDIRL